MLNPLPGSEDVSQRSGRTKRIVMWLVAIGIILPGGYGFVEKFIQFLRTLRSTEGGHFTILPIANYLLVTCGFCCLLIWAIRHGMFRDVEKPKYTMLERELELERLENRSGNQAGNT